jgi:hypothetical protein
MKMKIDEARIVAEGEWMYDAAIPCRIVILSEAFFPGSGDYGDPPEIAEDREVPCFSVWFSNLSCKDEFNAGGGYYLTLSEAIRAVEAKVKGPVTWKRRWKPNYWLHRIADKSGSRLPFSLCSL